MRFQIIITILFLFSLSACSSNEHDGKSTSAELVVFAAASLQDVIRDIGDAFADSNQVSMVYNFAGSNTLARQLVAAPKADVFLSASEQWMDYVQEADIIINDSRRTFLSNELVVIANRNSQWEMDSPADLNSLQFEYLSLGNPDAVPAGRYAKTWLESISIGGSTLWNQLENRIVPSPDVRAALGLVEADANILGIVYRTDAAMSNEVRVLYEVPVTQDPEIRYAAAIVCDRSAQATAREFLQFLESTQAKVIFKKYGFIPINVVKE